MLVLEMIRPGSNGTDVVEARAELRGSRFIVIAGHAQSFRGMGVPEEPIPPLDLPEGDHPDEMWVAFKNEPERYLRLLPKRYGPMFRVIET